MEPVIKVENLSKKYVINHQVAMGDSAFREVLSQKLKGILKGKFNKTKSIHEEFWALKNVSFEITKGDRVGIIGRNGAGKSTLLKILSQITDPTEGKITMEGRVSSLLEVGTGFHPELTGRENIFLNGAIIGMSKKEIESKFDQIVAFAEIEKFLDTPVKHYSSGMYVRLAFAISAHIDPDILIVDEALAVGDSAFQKKCLGKIEDISNDGRTVLFVSHSMQMITRLCNKVILLKSGSVEGFGNTEDVVNLYMRTNYGATARKSWDKDKKLPGDEKVKLHEVRIHDKNLDIKETYDITLPIGISMDYEVLGEGEAITHSYVLTNEQGATVFSAIDTVSDIRKTPRKPGMYSTTMWIPGNLLAEGMIVVSVAIVRIDPFKNYVHERDVVSFNIVDHLRGDSARGEYTLDFPGVVRPLLQWQTVKNEL